MTEQELLETLRVHNIPFETWGTGESKTLEHLIQEVVVTRESVLKPAGGRLMRTARGAALKVYHRHNGETLKLVEDRQVFADGRVRRRDDLDTSVGEKLSPEEAPEEGVRRALREELGIEEEFIFWSLGCKRRGPSESQSFPGLLTLYILHVYETMLPSVLFREEYVEKQKDKTSYFLWKPLKPC